METVGSLLFRVHGREDVEIDLITGSTIEDREDVASPAKIRQKLWDRRQRQGGRGRGEGRRVFVINERSEKCFCHCFLEKEPNSIGIAFYF